MSCRLRALGRGLDYMLCQPHDDQPLNASVAQAIAEAEYRTNLRKACGSKWPWHIDPTAVPTTHGACAPPRRSVRPVTGEPLRVQTNCVRNGEARQCSGSDQCRRVAGFIILLVAIVMLAPTDATILTSDSSEDNSESRSRRRTGSDDEDDFESNIPGFIIVTALLLLSVYALVVFIAYGVRAVQEHRRAVAASRTVEVLLCERNARMAAVKPEQAVAGMRTFHAITTFASDKLQLKQIMKQGEQCGVCACGPPGVDVVMLLCCLLMAPFIKLAQKGWMMLQHRQSARHISVHCADAAAATKAPARQIVEVPEEGAIDQKVIADAALAAEQRIVDSKRVFRSYLQSLISSAYANVHAAKADDAVQAVIDLTLILQHLVSEHKLMVPRRHLLGSWGAAFADLEDSGAAILMGNKGTTGRTENNSAGAHQCIAQSEQLVARF